MEDKRTRMKEHIFIGIINLTLIVGLVILTIHFFKTSELNANYIIGFIICYLWVPSILPAGYYYFRAEANSFYQRQPRLIFYRNFVLTPGLLIILAPFLVPNYIWMLILDIKNYKRNKAFLEER
ncbi:MAG: hypothetical protein K2J85_06860 [Anaeroplasmataceae bacterium]|nr:hypothetical protein [Anaeroplasmataceae bacterium]